jgi:hypothetical protein
MLQSIYFSTQTYGRTLEFADVLAKLPGMVTHRKISRKAHFAEAEGCEKQQTHAGADIVGTGHPTPLPIQPFTSSIPFNDHTIQCWQVGGCSTWLALDSRDTRLCDFFILVPA